VVWCEPNKQLLVINLGNYLSNLFFEKTSVGMRGRYCRHLIAGGFGTLLYMAGVTFFVEVVNVHPVVGATFSLVYLELYTYVIDRGWVYRSTLNHRTSIPRFLVVSIVALLLNAGVMYIAVEIMKWSYIWGLVATVLIVPPTNFLLNFYWAFK